MEHLSNGEWTLMNALWERQPATVAQLVHALAPETGWSKHTVMTMLSRLEQKGAVSCTQGERAREYTRPARAGQGRGVGDGQLSLQRSTAAAWASW